MSLWGVKSLPECPAGRASVLPDGPPAEGLFFTGLLNSLPAGRPSVECLSRKTTFLTTYVISAQLLAIRLENPLESSLSLGAGPRPQPWRQPRSVCGMAW